MKKEYDEAEDERVVADMSGIERRNLFFGRRPKGTRAELQDVPHARRNPSAPYQQEEEISSEQRRWYILGALKASLMIGAVYAIGFGIVILLMILIWSHAN